MGILEKLGIKKKSKEKAVTPKLAKPDLAVKTDSEKPAPVKSGRVLVSQAYQYLLRPILSEKGTHLAGSGRYVFAVAARANKPEIRKAIERLYDVHVTSVHIVKLIGKKRRYGRTMGRTSDWKKAIITVRAGEKIPGIIESVG